MNKKLFFMILITLFILLIVFLVCRLYLNDEARIGRIKKDIVIETCIVDPMDGGYAKNLVYYYVDFNKKKIYHVEDYYVYGYTSDPGEAGSHYSLKGSKKLSNDEIEEIKRLAEKETDFDRNSYNNNSRLDNALTSYYKITYRGKTVALKDSTASILVEIIGDI